MPPIRGVIIRPYQASAVALACYKAGKKQLRLTIEAALDGTLVDGVPDWNLFHGAFGNISINAEQVRRALRRCTANGHFNQNQVIAFLEFIEKIRPPEKVTF
jgi:hypothetical protein